MSLRTLAVVLLAATDVLAAGLKPDQPVTTAHALVVLPDYCNTTDGMCPLPDGSFLMSVNNFNDESKPPLIIRVTPDNKVEKYFEFPTPYPGLPAGLDRIRPMGICRDGGGNLYLADMQYMKDPNGKSRLWRLEVGPDGKVARMVLMADGFGVANGTAFHNGWVYITESVMEEGSHPLTSCVMRFRIGETNVHLTNPLKNDPHIITTYTSKLDLWRFGADGICFDSSGNLLVGLFGEGEIWKATFDRDGNVTSNTLFAKAPGMLKNCDGMSCDGRTDKVYIPDSASNAVRILWPDGHLTTLAVNGDVSDKRSGLLDQPCECLVRGDTVVASNMDWPFPGMVDSKHRMPAVISVMKMDR
jgi:sugar lactone lactonase YvrE